MCHNFAGSGGALTRGKYAPALRDIEGKHIYEAMVTGPQSMPVFNDDNISPEAKNDIVAYLHAVDEQENVGGMALGNLGPVSEGLFVWIFGLGIMVGFAVWLGQEGRLMTRSHPSGRSHPAGATLELTTATRQDRRHDERTRHAARRGRRHGDGLGDGHSDGYGSTAVRLDQGHVEGTGGLPGALRRTRACRRTSRAWPTSTRRRAKRAEKQVAALFGLSSLATVAASSSPTSRSTPSSPASSPASATRASTTSCSA